MNHHYPDNYHGGYVRGPAGMQGMGYGHGVYEDTSAMARMGHPRNSYPVPYRDNGQMHPMMQHPQQGGGMYPHGGYMGQMGSGGHYPMGNYPGYGMSGMNHAGGGTPHSAAAAMSMGQRGHNMMGNYYNHHVSTHHQHQQQQQQHPAMANQSPSSNYSPSPSGVGNPSVPHGGQGQMMSGPAMNNPNPSHSHSHAPAMQRNQGSVVTSAPSHGGSLTPANSNSNFPSQVSSPQSNSSMMMQQGSSHAQPRPVAESMSTGAGSHPVPQHPMRQQSSQQTPQEVADNILQIASSYPTNQTVQVPLKNRHAPYHIPRSPHYNVSSSEVNQASSAVSHFQQPSPASQPSPTPSTSSVKSPTPALAPIPNPIPSPGLSAVRSPSGHCLSPCGGSQRSPGHMVSYSGHSQPTASPQHYSPGGRGTPQQMSAYAHSPPPPQPPSSSSSSRNASLYPSSNDQTTFSPSGNQSAHSNFSNTQSPSPQTGNSLNSGHPNMPGGQYNQQCGGNNPLMSLQKLVMLPETQVVDPKSVVSDACLASQTSESIGNSKNFEDPAERFVESSDLSVGCSGQSSSLGSQSNDTQNVSQESLSSLSNDTGINSATNPTTEVAQLLDEVDNINRLPSSLQSHQVGQEGNVSQNSNTTTTSTDEHSNIQQRLLNENSQIETEDLTHLKSPQPDSLLSTETPHKDSVKGSASGQTDIQNACSDVFCDYMEVSTKIEDKFPSNDAGKDTTEEVVSFDSSFLPGDESPDSDAKDTSKNQLLSLADNKEGNPDVGKNESELSVLSTSEMDDPQVLSESKSPGVLSEVQVLVNGNDSKDEDKACRKNTRSKLRNGLRSLMRSKIGLTKKASQFVRLTTPCSIAVGADEREVCEQFAFRRNGYCHALRASRLLYSGRSRQDSTGHGDSDESVENLSDSNFHIIGNPQDGCKKKTITKKNDTKQSNSAQPQKHGKDSIKKESSHSKNVSTDRVTHPPEDNNFSEDEGEVCYYEGVDSSDFVMHNNSSEDSFSSSQDGVQTELGTVSPPKEKLENALDQSSIAQPKPRDNLKGDPKVEQEKEIPPVSSPPAKRTRRSLGKVSEDGIVSKYHVHSSSSDILSNGTDNPKELHSSESLHSHSTCDENSLKQENGKIAKARVNKRKPVLSKLPTNGQTKLPEVVVKIEKTELLKKPSDSDSNFIDLTNSPKKEEPIENDLESCGTMESQEDLLVAKMEAEYQGDDFQGSTKTDEKDGILNDRLPSSPSKVDLASVKSKKSTKKRIQKKNSPVLKAKEDEVKDSFKSMKFSRTLDMMKSQRKKEHSGIGPFLRVLGSRIAPKSVSVFNQSTQAIGASSGKQNQKSVTKQPVSSSATIHVMANLPNTKSVLVSSTKTINRQPWSCAFCNHQSSFHSLGDLFGPYYNEEDLPTVERLASEEAKKAKDVPQADKKGASASKKRKSLPKKDTGPQDVWIHEACALWAPGVYLIGNKLYGMDEAMKDASESICSSCKEKGAVIGCLHKGCAMKYHVSCALDTECCLDEENLSLLCPKHKDKRLRVITTPNMASVS